MKPPPKDWAVTIYETIGRPPSLSCEGGSHVGLSTLVFSLATAAAFAQQPQIPTLQVCNGTKASGSARVHLTARQDAVNSGDFELKIEAGCDPAGTGYPSGSIEMKFSLSDSSLKNLKVTSIEQMTTTGKHTPTMVLNGRCLANDGTIPCHIWLMIADNRQPNSNGTPDVIGVLVVDKTGKRITYGTGPISSGDISVGATGF